MNKKLSIKVSDLLKDIGKKDQVYLKGIIIPDIVGLDARGISATLQLQSIDNSTIIAIAEEIRCVIHDVSDISGKEYDRNVYCDRFVSYFVLPGHTIQLDDNDDASIFTIDEKNMVIDISEMLYQAIGLQTPFVKRSPDESAEDILDEDISTLPDSSIQGNIIFHIVDKK